MEAVDVLDIADEYGVEDTMRKSPQRAGSSLCESLKELSSAWRKRNFYLGGVLTSFINEGDGRAVGCYGGIYVKWDLIPRNLSMSL